MMLADESKCVNCHRCVSLCPTRALKIVKTNHTFKESANWTKKIILKNFTAKPIAAAFCLHLWAIPVITPVYWDKILINASQVTNPSIDPLREPMETRTYLGKKECQDRAGCQWKINSLIFP